MRISDKIQEALDSELGGRPPRPKSVVGAWRKQQERIKDGTSLYYLSNYALNNFESDSRYGNMQDAWVSAIGGAIDWFLGSCDRNNQKLLNALLDTKKNPGSPPKWFIDLYWDKIEPTITDKYGVFDYGRGMTEATVVNPYGRTIETTPTTYSGTNHFISLNAAYRYYEWLGFDKSDVDRKLKEGEIVIGLLGIDPNRVILNKGEGRYFLKDV